MNGKNILESVFKNDRTRMNGKNILESILRIIEREWMENIF